MNQGSHVHVARPLADWRIHKLRHNVPNIVCDNHYDGDDCRAVFIVMPSHTTRNALGKGKFTGGSLKRELVNLSHMRAALPEHMDANHAP